MADTDDGHRPARIRQTRRPRRNAGDFPQVRHTKKGTAKMLMTIAIVLVLLYAFEGLVTSYNMVGVIDLLLVVAIVVVLVRLIQGRKIL
jgi:uncharacterized membrane protein YtjA (UPF0391 family)